MDKLEWNNDALSLMEYIGIVESIYIPDLEDYDYRINVTRCEASVEAIEETKNTPLGATDCMVIFKERYNQKQLCKQNLYSQYLKEHEIQYVYNIRNPIKMMPTCKWENRLVRTGYFLKDNLNVNIEFNFDSHVPQAMKKDEFLKIKNIDYSTGIGFTICTLYFGIAGWSDREIVEQRKVKATFESCKFDWSETNNKNWIGWDSVTYSKTGLKNELEKIFPHKSKFEC